MLVHDTRMPTTYLQFLVELRVLARPPAEALVVGPLEVEVFEVLPWPERALDWLVGHRLEGAEVGVGGVGALGLVLALGVKQGETGSAIGLRLE